MGCSPQPVWLGSDFNQFYAAGKLAGTGHLYDWDALRKTEAETGLEVPTGRLPVVLFGYKILSWLPYGVARWIWLIVSVGALVVFASVWPEARRSYMIVVLAWSMPIALVLLYGQDIPFWLLFFGAGLWLVEREQPWLAGIAFALCICKFHLALGIPVLLAAQKRWRTLISGAMAVLVLLGLCFLIEGPKWPLEYAKMSKMPEFSPAAERMPNLYGLVSWLPQPAAWEIAGGLVVVFLLWMACRSTTEIGVAGAAAAACGLFLGHHCYAGDCALLIPISALILQQPRMKLWLKTFAALLISPLLVLVLVSQKPWVGQVLIAAFIAVAITIGIPKNNPERVIAA